jgi:hypothetical protein
MTADLDSLQRKTDLAEQLALVAIEMVLTLGAETGKRFDLNAYADAIDGEDGRAELAGVLRRMAASLEG